MFRFHAPIIMILERRYRFSNQIYTPSKIESSKNIGAFQASGTNIEILSRSRKNQGDHDSRRYKRNSRIDIFTSFNPV